MGGRLTGLSDQTSLRHVAMVLSVVLVVMVPVLMLNLIIAALTSSYAKVERDADVEWKLSRASAVIVAREMAAVPTPLSLPQDFVRLLRKLSRKANTLDHGTMRGKPTAAVAATSQGVAQWEARRSLERLGSLATAGEVERLRRQGEGILERVNVLHLVLKPTSDSRSK